MVTVITDINNKINGFVWGLPMMVLILGVGIFLSARCGFLQFRHFVHIMKNTLGKAFEKTEKKEGSYTTYLFEKGIDKILKKVGEECTEVIIAGKADDKAETIYEISDLVYHVLVLMVEMGISIEDIRKELASRHVIDHKIKQEKMTK